MNPLLSLTNLKILKLIRAKILDLKDFVLKLVWTINLPLY